MVSACERSRCTILNSSSLRDITEPRHAPQAPRVSSNALPRALFLPQKQASKKRGRADSHDATEFGHPLEATDRGLNVLPRSAKANARHCPRFPEFQFRFQRRPTDLSALLASDVPRRGASAALEPSRICINRHASARAWRRLADMDGMKAAGALGGRPRELRTRCNMPPI